MREHKGKMTRGQSMLKSPNGEDPHPLVDMELRDLIARCMYRNLYDRPNLDQVLLEVQKGASKTSPDSFPNPPLETDESIRRLWQELLYDVSHTLAP